MSTDMLINGLNSPSLTPPASGPASKSASGFGDMLQGVLKQVNDLQNRGDQATLELHAGKIENLHEVMIAVEQADISLRMLVQVRNKAQQAYEEIMRMQI